MRRWRQLIAVLSLMFATPAPGTDNPQARFDAIVQRMKAAMLTDPRAAIDLAAQGEQVGEAIPSPADRHVAMATVLWLQAEARFRIDDLDSAASLIARARGEIEASAPKSKLQGDILLTSGSIHGSRTEVAAALTDFVQAHDIFVRVKDARGQAISLICISTLYKDAKDYKKALKYLDEAIEIDVTDPSIAYGVHNNRGVILRHSGLYEQADREFTVSLQFARKLNSQTTYIQAFRNRARNNLQAGKLRSAERDISIARRLVAKIGGKDEPLTALAGQAALRHGHLAEAGRLINLAFVGIDLTTTPVTVREAHEAAYDVYRALHQDDKALAHLIALKRIDDESTRLATQTSTALMAARFDAANQEAKIRQLRDAERLRVARDALEQARFERSLLRIGGAAGMVILVLLLINVVTLRRSRDRVRAASDALAGTNTALNKALAAKTEFLATTSHEIRTPLNGILGMTQVLLADATLTPAVTERLTVVHGAGLTMCALVDDILDVAKMETGNLAIEHAPFDPRACLTDAAVMWAEQARGKGLVFAADFARLPPLVSGDAARVRQIAFNLLSNAIKFTAAGAVSISAEAANDGIVIRVSDTGIGVATGAQGDIFEPFRQADASTTRRFGGTGLGLSICRSLARAMGGDIALVSAPGQGSTFIVTLPLPVATPAPVRAEADGDGPSLLVVERNPIARAMFRSLLAPHVGVVRFAVSAKEAVACLATGDVGGVLIDDATARAEGDPRRFVAEVVAAAGYAPVTLLWPATDSGEQDALIRLGVTTLLLKPVSGAALIAALFPIEPFSGDIALVSQAA